MNNPVYVRDKICNSHFSISLWSNIWCFRSCINNESAWCHVYHQRFALFIIQWLQVVVSLWSALIYDWISSLSRIIFYITVAALLQASIKGTYDSALLRRVYVTLYSWCIWSANLRQWLPHGVPRYFTNNLLAKGAFPSNDVLGVNLSTKRPGFPSRLPLAYYTQA